MVIVASWESGQVLGAEILTKYCSECGHHEGMSKESEEYKQWWEEHKNKCDVNYHRSSPAMEAIGSENLATSPIYCHHIIQKL